VGSRGFGGSLQPSENGAPGESHRLPQAPLALSANVFTSLPRSQFTVKGLALSTVLFNCFKGLAVFRDFIAPTPAGDHPPSMGIYDVVGGFGVV
jgi:hypothetical protein